MEMTRRGFLKGMAGILAAGVAPAAIGSNILMPVRKLWTPETTLWTHAVSSSSAFIKVMSIWHDGTEHEIDPVTLYRGDASVIHIPGCEGKVFAYKVSYEWTKP